MKPRTRAGAIGGGVLLSLLAVADSARPQRAPAQTAVATVAGQDVALRRALESMRDSMSIRGVSAAVIFPDGSMWTGVAGEASAGVAVTPATVFEAGSVTKMFTAALVLTLAEERVIGLDQPVVRWLADAPRAAQVTPRMLLRHTSGWADVWDDSSFVPKLTFNASRRWLPSEVLAATPPPIALPGEKWDYSSTGYVALGMIAEAAAGRPFAGQLRERLIDPLGLERTFYAAADDPTEPMAHGFVDIDGDGRAEDFTLLVSPGAFRTAAGAAGALVASAGDLARWTRAFVTGALHSPATFADVFDWVVRPDGRRHGLGVLRTEVNGRVLVGHMGNTAGFSAGAWHVPDLDLTVVVLTNKDRILVTPVVSALIAAAVPR